MEEKIDAIKKAIKRFFKIIFIPSSIILIFLVAIVYNVITNDGSYKEGDSSNTSYAVKKYNGNVTIDGDGKITSDGSAKDLWNQMIEDGSRVDNYLNNAIELKKLINAERITDYIDTRTNQDEDIDWSKINLDVESTEVQGIIKLKRAKDDGTISQLTYTDPATFQYYIDNYNKSGSDEDKKIALSYFTLERGYKGSGMFGTGETITAGTTIIIPSGLGKYHTYMGWQMITSTTSMQYKLIEQAGMNFDEEGFGRINGRYVIACTTTFGKVGDYIDFYQEDGSVIQCIIGDIKNQNDAGCTEWGHNDGQVIVEFVVDKDSWYNSNHPNPGSNGFHAEWSQSLTKAVNGGSYFDNPDFGSQNVTSNGITTGGNNSAIGNGLMKWPTDGTTITSYFGNRTDPTTGEENVGHGAIDIGVSTGTNVYATEAGTVTTAGWSDSAGNWVIIDHGNGYITKYMHNSELKVSAGEKVEKGQIIALSGSTGKSTGPHVHFQIEYNGVAVDPLSFKYDNGMGDGTGGIGSNSNSLSTTTTLYAKVATWNEMTDTIVSTDPSVEGKSTASHSMSSTKIDYQKLVSGYKMPFDYLWALLVTTEDKAFVFAIADLVYDSEIEITIHDNLSVNTNVNIETYTNMEKIRTDEINVEVNYSDTYATYDNWDTEHQYPYEVTSTGSNIEIGGPYSKENSYPYETTHTVVTKTNTLDVGLTKANTWIVDYSQEFKQEVQEPTITSSETAYDDEEYPDTPDKTDNNDTAGLAEEFRKMKQEEYIKLHDTATATIKSLKSEYYYKTIDRKVSITNTLENTKYISSPPILKEKIDKESDENNIIKILVKYRSAREKIIKGAPILFNILKKSPDTVDMIDLTKYLIYVVTDGKTQYNNIDEFDFSIFNPENFEMMDAIYGSSSNIEGVQGKVYDFLLKKGVPIAGGAAVMGNIEDASNFDPAYVDEKGYGGLCKWSGERLNKLKELAETKGVEWTDLDLQLEYMWSELENSKNIVKDKLTNATTEVELEYTTWYFGRHFEAYFTSYNYEISKQEQIQQRRYRYAKKWYDECKEKYTGGTLGNGKVYYQNDYADVTYGGSNIASCGCGPTCFAMVACDYGVNITPKDAVTWCGNAYYVYGAGTSWAYFAAATKHFNLPATCVDLGNDINKAISELKKGNLVISSQSAGIFTSGGHYILLSGINSDGGIIVRDPNKNNAVNKGYNARSFTANEISSSGKNYWSFQK